MDAEIRAFSLISEKALDDRAVEELARSISYSASLGGEALGSLTRREAELSFGDLLEPIEPDVATSRSGVRFSVTLADDPGMVLAVLFLSEAAAVALADVFFGGPGEGVERRLTDIEAQAVTSSMANVIAPVVAVLSGLEGCRVSLEHVKAAPLPSASLVELAMRFVVGSAEIEAALFAPDPDGSGVDLTSRDAMAETVKGMPVDVEIELASVQMAALEVQALSDGDVIVFDAAPDSEALARSGDQELLRGRVGEDAGRRFLEVTEVLVAS